jgi:hypothetical protein
MPLYR